jgi:hypothetical protein
MNNGILQGAYDLHTHSGPDCLPRKFDDFEMAQRVIDSGMAGFAIKSHYFCTADRATLTNKIYPKCHAVGTMWLNNSVGGMNPVGVDMAGRAGAKIIGFPTVDTEASITRTFELPPEKRGYWARIIIEMKEEGIELKPVKIFGEDGKPLPVVYDVLDTIAKHNMILATGHTKAEETVELVKAAHERKIERIIATHVSSQSTFHDLDTQKELVKYGAYLEHCTNGVSSGKIPYELMLNQIQTMGPEHCIICTDLGQPKNKYPDEGILDLCNMFLESGMPESDVRKMIVDNPKTLLSA